MDWRQKMMANEGTYDSGLKKKQLKGWNQSNSQVERRTFGEQPRQLDGYSSLRKEDFLSLEG